VFCSLFLIFVHGTHVLKDNVAGIVFGENLGLNRG
jgi:hypothetical protein